MLYMQKLREVQLLALKAQQAMMAQLEQQARKA